MSYNSVNRCANDPVFVARIQACVAQEQIAAGNPVDVQVAYQLNWTVAAADDIEAAYESALAANNPNPGGDESVIPDQMILSAVQAAIPAAQVEHRS